MGEPQTVRALVRHFATAAPSFRRRGQRLYRTTRDGLIDIVQFQTAHLPQLELGLARANEDEVGPRLAVNLGVLVPEIYEFEWGAEVTPERCSIGDCHIVDRLVQRGVDRWPDWFPLDGDALGVAVEIETSYLESGLRFFEAHSTRERILAEFEATGRLGEEADTVSALRAAILYAAIGKREAASMVLQRVYLKYRAEHGMAGFVENVRQVAERLGAHVD